MIVGFCGYSKSGKDTAAIPLIKRGYQRLAFADQLKETVAEVLGIEVDSVERMKEALRPLLVEFGRAARMVNRDFWVDSVEDKINNIHFRRGLDVVITDVRYENEVDMICRNDGIVYYIHRPDFGPANFEEAESIGSICDSRMLLSIHNDGTVDELETKVVDIVMGESAFRTYKSMKTKGGEQ